MGEFDLFFVGLDDGGLDVFATLGVDGVGDVGVQLGAAAGGAVGTALIELGAAVAAEAGAEMVLGAAGGTVVSDLARGHGDEITAGAFDNFEVADNKGVVESNRTKGFKTIGTISHKFDSDFRNLHGAPPGKDLRDLENVQLELQRHFHAPVFLPIDGAFEVFQRW